MRFPCLPVRWCAASLIPLVVAARLTGLTATATYIIHVSVDGLRPDAVQALGASGAPAFNRLKTEGAFTENARTDYDYTITLPNHTCQLTGRPVLGSGAHAWISNSDPLPGQTLHTNNGSYVAGVFDVVHDAGLRTGLFASKSKFSLFAVSWDATNGAPDATGADDGRSKIDVYRNNGDTTALVNELLTQEAAQPMAYAFLHLADTDNAGHACGWDATVGSCYSTAVKKVDTLIGQVLAFVGTDPRMVGRTMVIVTTDHGGVGTNHSDSTNSLNFTIPFYVWGAGSTAAADLYVLNPVSRLNPGSGRPLQSAVPSSIRNGDAANLAARALGLPSVPGSKMGLGGTLASALPLPIDVTLQVSGTTATVGFTSEAGFHYDFQSADALPSTTWTTWAGDVPGTGAMLTRNQTVSAGTRVRFYRINVHP